MDERLRADQQLWNGWAVEDHPFMRVFSSDPKQGIKVDNLYFFSKGPHRAETGGAYATDFQGKKQTYSMWDPSLGEVINSLIEV
jgi:hypothetical protein